MWVVASTWFLLQMEHLKACAEIAAQRTTNWQKFCIKDDCKQCLSIWLLFMHSFLQEVFIEAPCRPSVKLGVRNRAMSKLDRQHSAQQRRQGFQDGEGSIERMGGAAGAQGRCLLEGQQCLLEVPLVVR